MSTDSKSAAPLDTALRESFLEATEGRVRFNEPMRLHTTFRIGGPAEIWAEPASHPELLRLLALANEAALPITVVGGGANLLVKDEGIPGLVLRLSHPAFQGFQRDPFGAIVGAGLPIEGMIHRCQEEGLTGVEFLAGVPGRVGGAVSMNAGTHDTEGRVHSFSEVIHSVTVVDRQGSRKALSRDRIPFAYRTCGLDGQIVLQTSLELDQDTPKAIARRVKSLWDFKRKTQDWTRPSVGCIFKNPSASSLGDSKLIPAAAWLVDQAGLKGRKVGQAMVSRIHANFIVNLGNATCADVLGLIEVIRDRVQKTFGMALELEVKVLPRDGCRA